jgi:putative ABC transport system permease protein
VAGGLIGVGAGVGVATWLAGRFHWPVRIQTDVISVSVGFSALVGIVFGIYPARKASQLDPIDALRFE